MKNLCFLLTALLGLSSSVFSGECCQDNYWGGCNRLCANGSAELEIGYRQDNLKWAFNGFSPGESIHQSWNDINIGFVGISAEQSFCDDVIYFDADYGVSGTQKAHHVKLIDYNSEAITFRPTTKTKAQVYDISIRVGRKYRFCCDQLVVTPQLGWSYNHQRFKNPSFYDDTRFSSRYSWNTALLGFDVAYQFCCDWTFDVSYAYHYGYFEARVNEFFRSRSRSKQCFGNEVGAGLYYQPCGDWIYGLKFNYKHYLGYHKGSASDTFDDNSHKRRPSWNSLSLSASVGLNF